jgi:hypothetical protein
MYLVTSFAMFYSVRFSKVALVNDCDVRIRTLFSFFAASLYQLAYSRPYTVCLQKMPPFVKTVNWLNTTTYCGRGSFLLLSQTFLLKSSKGHLHYYR